MKKTNALKLRQNLGTVLKGLLKDSEPILVEKDRKPVAVLITLEDYQKRFVDIDADIKRKELILSIKKSALSLPKRLTSLGLIKEIRR